MLCMLGAPARSGVRTCDSRSASQVSWSRVFSLWMLTSSARRLSVHSSAVVGAPAGPQHCRGFWSV